MAATSTAGSLLVLEELCTARSSIRGSGLRLLAQKAGDVAGHLRLHSRALRRSFARLLGTGTARRPVEIDGGLIPERGIGQHAVDTALPLGGDDGFGRHVSRLSMPFLSQPLICHSLFTPFIFGNSGLRQILDSAGSIYVLHSTFAEPQARVAQATGAQK
jgi:hypothetical protein